MTPEEKQFKEFLSYFTKFTQNKRNQLDFSNTTNPNRIIPVRGLSLATDLKGLFQEFKIPVRSVHVEKIYSETTGEAVSGELKMAFDYNNIGNVQNYKLLQANDTFVLDQTISKFALGWDVQPGVLVDLAFMIDVEYRSGSTKTALVGTVSTIITSPPIPKGQSFALLSGTPGVPDFSYYTAGALGGKLATVKIRTNASVDFFIDGNPILANRVTSYYVLTKGDGNLYSYPDIDGAELAPVLELGSGAGRDIIPGAQVIDTRGSSSDPQLWNNQWNTTGLASRIPLLGVFAQSRVEDRFTNEYEITLKAGKYLGFMLNEPVGGGAIGLDIFVSLEINEYV